MLAPDRDQVVETVQDGGFGRGAGQVGEEAVACQHGGVDAVVLGEPADGFGEAPGAQRVDRDGFETGVEQALVQLAVVAPGGFEGGAGDAVLDQPVAQSAAAGLGVGEVAGLAARFEIGVESGLANIDAGDYSWGGNGHCCVVFLSRASRHSCVPVLLRCGSVPTLPLRACRNCCDGPTKLEHGSKGRGGKRSDPSAPGAWPGPRRPPRTRRGGICCRPLRRLPPPAAREERFPDPVWVPALRHLSNIKGGGPGGSAGATAVAGGESAGLGEHQGQGRQQADARGAARAQLPDAAGGSGHAHAEPGDAAGRPAAPVSDGRQADAAAGQGIRLARGRSGQICCQ